MKHFQLFLFLILCIFPCHAQIVQVKDIQETASYFHNAGPKTLAIFDVDMVLVQPSDPVFQMANIKRYGEISKCILKGIPQQKQMIFLSLMTTASEPILIDSSAPQFINCLRKRGIPTIALTANLTGALGNIKNMESWRIDSLRCLGIDFATEAPYPNSIVFKELPTYRGNYSTYREGVIIVNGTTVSKGDALLAFLKTTKLLPEKIIFIDDREDNLKNVEAAIQQLDSSIEYLALHYLGAQSYPSIIVSEEEFQLKWQRLALQAVEME